jgi:hypothetical protein
MGGSEERPKPRPPARPVPLSDVQPDLAGIASWLSKHYDQITREPLPSPMQELLRRLKEGDRRIGQADTDAGPENRASNEGGRRSRG